MKKTIQTNIAGMVFNIEEDAYEKLNAYLRSIQQYFSSYEGSQEIVSDIEARIAEKFWNKQKLDNQQVITAENINELIKSMGNVTDFEAIVEEEDLKHTTTNKTQAEGSKEKAEESKNAAEKSSQSTIAEPKKLCRDTRRKALGGVLAGLAHYFNIDVVWLRIIYLVLFFGLAPMLDTGGFSGVLLIAYFVCWIVFPPNLSIEENQKIKKFYRSDDDKVIGGVSGGLAAYFGTDSSVIRLVFVLFGFFGAGIIAYIILWLVAPKAESLTQKMEMKGEPVTLENIETNIKQNLKEEKSAPESAITKILLFPFRMIALIFKGLGTILKSLGPIARIIAGIFMMVVAIGSMVAGVVSLSILWGLISGDVTPWGDFQDNPFGLIAADIHPASGFFASLAAFMPLVAMLLSGLILVTNRRIGTRNFWMTLLGLWLAGILGSGILATKYAMNFKNQAKVVETKTFPTPNAILVLDSDDNDVNKNFNGRITNEVRIELEGFGGNELKLEQNFEAKGRTRQEAEVNAKNIIYTIAQKDSLLVFDRNLDLKDKARFRGQELNMKLFIPFDKQFKMTKDFYYNVYRFGWHEDRSFDINGDDVDKYTYVMKKDSGMVCLDCPKLSEEEREALNNHEFDDSEGSFNYGVFEEEGRQRKEFDLKDFNKIEAGGAFVVTVRKGNTFRIKANSDDQDNLDDLQLKVRNNQLEIEYEDRFTFRRRDKVRFEITMPTLEGINFSGASIIKIIGFDDKSKDLKINLTGASKAAIDVEVRKINFDASGASVADIQGVADEIDVDISGACRVDARKLIVNRVNAQASGACKAKFGKVKDLNSDTSGASKITRE